MQRNVARRLRLIKAVPPQRGKVSYERLRMQCNRKTCKFVFLVFSTVAKGKLTRLLPDVMTCALPQGTRYRVRETPKVSKRHSRGLK